MLDAENPSTDLLDAWTAGHRSLHKGSVMLDALSRVGADLTMVTTSMLWRLVDGRGGMCKVPATQVAAALNAMRETEKDLIGRGDLPAVGLLASIRC